MGNPIYRVQNKTPVFSYSDSLCRNDLLFIHPFIIFHNQPHKLSPLPLPPYCSQENKPSIKAKKIVKVNKPSANSCISIKKKDFIQPSTQSIVKYHLLVSHLLY